MAEKEYKYRVIIISMNPVDNMIENTHQWIYDYETYEEAKNKMIEEMNKDNHLKELAFLKL